MKVGIFLPEVFNPKVGGVYNYNRALITELNKFNSDELNFLLIAYNDFHIDDWSSKFEKVILNRNTSFLLLALRIIRKIIGSRRGFINKIIDGLHADYIRSNHIDLFII